jgi:AraC-like DNA-binding protein
MIEGGIKVPAVIIPSLVKVAARMGLSVPRLLTAAGLDEAILQLSDDVIEFETMNRFMLAMVEQSELPTIGLYIGCDLGFDYLPDFERYITTSATARDAIRAIYLFQRFSPYYHFELREKPNLGEAHLLLSISDDAPEALRSIYIEMLMTLIDRFGKIILGERYKLKKLVLGSRLNGPLLEYKKIFEAPIEAGAVVNALILDLTLLDLPLVNALPQENEKAEQELRLLIKGALNKHGFKAKLQEAMRKDINLATGTVEQAANFMALSVRALQRKLKEEDATFSQIQLEVRMEFAMLALGKPDLSIEAISEHLGFSNRRSFTRAFHQWYGTTPSTYRKLARPGRVDV